MDFHLFMYCTVGRRAELEAGMAGQRPELYQRMLDEIAEYARFADEAGYAGFGHPEHHLQVGGREGGADQRVLPADPAGHPRSLADLEVARAVRDAGDAAVRVTRQFRRTP
jgi:hypothetical protein